MGKGIPALEQAYGILFIAALVILAVFLMLSLVRAIIGPRVADRIVAINMMGTLTLAIRVHGMNCMKIMQRWAETISSNG